MVAGEQCGEQVMTLVEAAGWLERRFGRRPNAASIWRWATKGIKGVRLATISLGRFRYTTENALERFIAESSRAEPAHAGKPVAATSAELAFTKREVAAAAGRREREKAKALEYLQAHMGTSGKGRPRRKACK